MFFVHSPLAEESTGHTKSLLTSIKRRTNAHASPTRRSRRNLFVLCLFFFPASTVVSGRCTPTLHVKTNPSASRNTECLSNTTQRARWPHHRGIRVEQVRGVNAPWSLYNTACIHQDTPCPTSLVTAVLHTAVYCFLISTNIGKGWKP